MSKRRNNMLINKVVYLPALVFIFLTSFSYAGPIEDCKEYAALGVPGTEGNLLCRKGYLLAHDAYYKTPIWVAEHLTKEKANTKAERKDNFKADPDLRVGERAELSDYASCSKTYDRGHMAPSADMRWNTIAMKESCFLSNVVPQNKNMNQQIWKQLEMKVRKWAIDRGEVYIYTGPIYDAEEVDVVGSNEVAVPTHIYKIVYDPKKVEAIAFIMPNEPLNIKDIPNFITTINDIEQKTDLDFLPTLKRKVQDAIEKDKADGLW